MRQNLRFDWVREHEHAQSSAILAIAVFRCASCGAIEQANGALLHDFATFDDCLGWSTLCPICGDAAKLEALIRFLDGNQVQIERDGQCLRLPASLIAPIVEITSGCLERKLT